LAVEVVAGEKSVAYCSLVQSLLSWGLKGVCLVMSGDHEGIKAAVSSEPSWDGVATVRGPPPTKRPDARACIEDEGVAEDRDNIKPLTSIVSLVIIMTRQGAGIYLTGNGNI
jgi:hypothetical protein